ncbi:hypothetical protein BpHYR1_020872, partial [Brachionus plicatilis]
MNGNFRKSKSNETLASLAKKITGNSFVRKSRKHPTTTGRKRKGTRGRKSIFDKNDLIYLNTYYERKNKPNHSDINNIILYLECRYQKQQIRNWFSNKRFKEKSLMNMQNLEMNIDIKEEADQNTRKSKEFFETIETRDDDNLSTNIDEEEVFSSEKTDGEISDSVMEDSEILCSELDDEEVIRSEKED